MGSGLLGSGVDLFDESCGVRESPQAEQIMARIQSTARTQQCQYLLTIASLFGFIV